MTLLALFADLAVDPRLPNSHLILPVFAGIVAGIGGVAAFHYLVRPRLATPPPPREEQAPDPFVTGSASEQRKSFRRQGNPIEVAIVDQATRSAQLRGWVVNRSMGGLCLLTEEAFVPERKLAVRPVNAPQITPWTEVTVKTCRESTPGWEVGCQFDKQPPWPILLMFG